MRAVCVGGSLDGLVVEGEGNEAVRLGLSGGPRAMFAGRPGATNEHPPRIDGVESYVKSEIFDLDGLPLLRWIEAKLDAEIRAGEAA